MGPLRTVPKYSYFSSKSKQPSSPFAFRPRWISDVPPSATQPARPFDIVTRNRLYTHYHILKRGLLPFPPSWFCHALHISASLIKQQEVILAI